MYVCVEYMCVYVSLVPSPSLFWRWKCAHLPTRGGKGTGDEASVCVCVCGGGGGGGGAEGLKSSKAVDSVPYYQRVRYPRVR